MKTLIAMIAVLFAAGTASALESHYGKISYQGGKYNCSYTNDGAAKNFKWVYFAVERRVGKDRDVSAQYKVDQVVQPGETITVASDFGGNYAGWYCKFLAR